MHLFLVFKTCVLDVLLNLNAQTKPAIPALERLIHSHDEEVLTDACWALSYLSDGTNEKIQAVIDAGPCPRLVELLTWVSSFIRLFELVFDCLMLEFFFFFSYKILMLENSVWLAIPLQRCSFLPFAQLEILSLEIICKLRCAIIIYSVLFSF